MPRPGRNFEKSKDFKGSMKRLLKSLNNYRYLLIISLIFAFISAILALISPNKLSLLTDEITLGIKPNVSEEKINSILSSDTISIEDKIKLKELMDQDSNYMDKISLLPESIYNEIKPEINMTNIKKISLLLLILYVTSSLLGYLESFILTTISNNFAKNLRSKISLRINSLPLKYFDKNETGDVLSRVTNDVDTISQNMNQSIATLVSSITLFIGSVIMMFVTNYIMAITAIISSLIGFTFMASILKKSQKYFVERQKILGSLNGYIEEIYSGHNVVKAYNGYNYYRI